VDAALARGLLRLMEDQARVARRERRGIVHLEGLVGETAVLVPELDSDVHDLRGLRQVGEMLLGEGPSRPKGRRRRAALQAQGRG
jgi:hypothetical protein